MKILLTGINFSPELVGAGKYTGEMADWLFGCAHEMRVITAPPYYPQWHVQHGYSRWRYKTEGLGDVSGKAAGFDMCSKILRCPIWVPQRPGGVKRLLHLLSFALSSFPVSLAQLRWRPDVVLIMAPTFMSVPGALLVARLAGARAWLHVQDFELDAAFEMGILRSGYLRRLFSGLERWLLRKFDRVSTISAKMQDKLVEKGVPRDRTWLLPNWVDTDVIAPAAADNPFRAELGIPADAIVALYSGNMGEKQGLDLVVEAARAAGLASDIVFVMCGEGSARAGLQAAAANIRNLLFLPLQPASRLNDLLNLADIHMLPQRQDVADLVMPSKLTGMLASGRPVVATALPGTQVADVVGRCGLVVPPGDARAFLDAITRLATDRAERVRLGAAGRRIAVETLSREAVLQKFESSLRDFAGCKNSHD